MRATLALLRAAWLTALSYRVSFLLSLAAAAATVVPVYYVAGALQGTMAGVIRGETAGYFGFVLVGLLAFNLATAAANTLPTAVASGIGNGTLEALLATPASTLAVLAGLSGYGLVWALVRGVVLVAGGLALGLHLEWHGVPLAALTLLLVAASYLALGMLDAAVVVVFRVRTPLVAAALTASALLGGVYYPATVVPSWLARLTPLVPLTYGARMVRRALLEGEGVAGVAGDLVRLAGVSLSLVAVGAATLALALRHARRAGSLGQY